jgi:hypothetical protein
VGTPAEFEAGRQRLWNELVNLHDTWDEYRLLFADSADRLEMLNACAPWFFGRTQRLLMREVILGLSRLTDNAKTSGRKNLIIDFLLEDPELDRASAAFMELKTAVSDAREAAKPFRTHRHKYIAHLDHEVAVASEELLPGLSRVAITAAITALEAAYNVHNGRMKDAHAIFELRPLGGAQALVRILENSDRWARMRQIRDDRQGGASATDGAA